MTKFFFTVNRFEHWNQIDTMVGVRVSEADEMNCSTNDELADVRAIVVLRWMCVHNADGTGRKCDDDGVANP